MRRALIALSLASLFVLAFAVGRFFGRRAQCRRRGHVPEGLQIGAYGGAPFWDRCRRCHAWVRAGNGEARR